MLNTILFDLDGTLLPFWQDDFIHTYFKMLVACAAPMGYDGKQLTDAVWKGTAAMVENDGGVTNRQAFWETFTQELGIAAMSLESVLNDFYSREFDQVRSVLREPVDRRPLIRGLREKGYLVVLATNPIFPETAVETRLGWAELSGEDFDYITTYENSRRSKPNPDYYRDILEQIGREPEECLMIGNNPVDDMAAVKAGLSGYLVTDSIETPNNLPVESYPHGSFRELAQYLEQLPVLSC